ncbi:MAG: hypothetical protein ACUVQQ_15605 [Thermogutta sp.]
MVSASTRSRSYEEASAALQELAELEISAKRCARITQRIGRERLAERAARSMAFEQQPLPTQKGASPADAPANGWEGRVAAVVVDGGRLQLRDERWGTPKEPGERRSWWREPKLGVVVTFQSRESAEDPLPEIPASLLDPLFVIPRVMEMKRARAGMEGSQEAAVPARLPEAPASEPHRWSPPPLVQSVVGTLRSYEELGLLVETEAWHRGFATASRKVFLGDGLAANWRMHQKRFSRYVPVVDLMHAMAYIYTAAMESSSDMEGCWERYGRWMQAVWRGRVAEILPELEGLVHGQSDPQRRATLADCFTYLSHNAGRMRYDEYRRQGLPITTALGESKIKQLNRRMKGTEKFWRDGAEPQLQLCCDQLSDTCPMEGFWQRRAARQNGFRKSRAPT